MQNSPAMCFLSHAGCFAFQPLSSDSGSIIFFFLRGKSSAKRHQFGVKSILAAPSDLPPDPIWTADQRWRSARQTAIRDFVQAANAGRRPRQIYPALKFITFQVLLA